MEQPATSNYFYSMAILLGLLSVAMYFLKRSFANMPHVVKFSEECGTYPDLATLSHIMFIIVVCMTIFSLLCGRVITYINEYKIYKKKQKRL